MTEPETELKKVHTSCRDCCFAVYEGKTQTGCALGRLDIYRRQSEVIPAHDDELEFELINGRHCAAKRTNEWAKTITFDKRKEKIREELRAKLDFVIILEGEVSLDDLKKTIGSIAHQTLPAHSIHVINNHSSVSGASLQAYLMKSGLPWGLTNILEKKSDGKPVEKERALDIAVPKLNGHMYSIWCAGSVVPFDFSSFVDDSLNIRLERWNVLRPDHDGNGLTVHRGFHLNPLVLGNRAMPATNLGEKQEEEEPILLTSILEKSEYLAIKQEMPWMVEDVVLVCPTLW